VHGLGHLRVTLAARPLDFWQLLDPAGLVFCVVGIQTGEAFERDAVSWP
jgi:hypothetical protein